MIRGEVELGVGDEADKGALTDDRQLVAVDEEPRQHRHLGEDAVR